MLVYSGCSTKNDRLFQAKTDPFDGAVPSTKIDDVQYKLDSSYEYKIALNDRVSVNIFIKSDTSSQQFIALLNKQSNPTSATNINNQNNGYLVNQQGNIILPLLNSVNVVGLTEYEASNMLIKKYKKYVKNPFVVVNIVNQRVIVIGEVKKPGIIPIINGRINLIEVIAQSGYFKDTAERTNIKIIRGNLRDPKIRIVDLTKLENITNGSLELKPNDIVYVQPRHIKGINKAITEISPFFVTLSNILNPFIQRKTLIGKSLD
jgi:polysaccharide export outer membrane protein